jgi:Peptidase inhibitor I78 family
MKYAALFVLCAPLLLSACVVTTLPTPVDPVDDCRASELQYLVGKPGVVLDGMRFSQDVRVIKRGTMVTMDFRSDRLNFWLDDLDRIERVACG